MTGQGRSSHLSHQTGQQFNLMLVPQDDKLGRVRSDGEKPAWDREAPELVHELIDVEPVIGFFRRRARRQGARA